MARHASDNSDLVCYLPWLLALGIAPLWFGSGQADGQAAVGLLMALSLGLLGSKIGPGPAPILSAWLWMLGLGLLILPLLPLPIGLVGILSPTRASLAKAFPVELGTVPAFIPLSVSTSGTVQRLWELSLVAASFLVGRQAGRSGTALPWLAGVLALSVVCLVGSDLWYRWDGRRSILGIWNVSWGKGEGTFANPNHFANWIYTATLFLLGGVFRGLWPFQSARLHALPRRRRSIASALVLAVMIIAGWVMAVASGSRGGFAGLAVGLSVWVVLVRFRTRSRGRWAVVAFAGLGVFLALLAASDLLLRKFAAIDTGLLNHYTKFELWRQTVQLAIRFPLVGVGWGGFMTAFSCFKEGFAGFACWHAENEYLELIAETGLAGLVTFGVAGWLIARTLIRFCLNEPIQEPEYAFGALAGLAAFAVSATFEFIFQITANAVLAGALAGYLAGTRDAVRSPRVTPPPSNKRWIFNCAFALALGAAATFQGMAFWHWDRAQRAPTTLQAVDNLDHSLRLWPWASNRQIALTRQRVKASESTAPQERVQEGKQFREELDRSLQRDPFNWELRLERAWLDLAFSTNAARSLAESREVMRLNRMQPLIPLRFAAHYADFDPQTAREFLQATDRSDPVLLRRVLELSWRIDPDTGSLWALTPVTRDGLLTLGEFALKHELHPMAAQAFLLLTNQVAPTALAGRFLDAKRADLALLVLTNIAPSSQSEWLRVQAAYALGDHAQVIELTEAQVLRTRLRKDILTGRAPTIDLGEAQIAWQSKPNDQVLGLQLAERMWDEPPGKRDLVLLAQVAERFPANLRLTWLLFQTQRQVGMEQSASTTALKLMRRLAEVD